MARQRGRRQHQEDEPQRRREIGHDTGHEHRAVGRMQALRQKQAEVLQIALAPALVALQFVEQRRRHFLVTARQIVGDPHAPAGAPHQRRLDEVVAHDLAGQRAAAGQLAERAVADERRHADHRVVTPVVGFAELPEMQPGREQRPVAARRELLDARVQGVAPRGHRRGLDDAGRGIGLHQLRQAVQTVARHHAVGVEDHHVLVAAAPAPAPVGDVAALALDAVLATPVEDVAEAVHLLAQLHPGLDLGDADVGFGAVAEYVEIEARQLAGAARRFEGGAQSGEDAMHVLVADRHQDRGAHVVGDCGIGFRRRRNRVFVPTRKQGPEAHQRGPEAGRHPGEQDRVQDQNGQFQRVLTVVRQHRRHEIGAVDRLADHQAQQQQATDGAGHGPGRQLGFGFACVGLARGETATLAEEAAA